MLHPYEIPDDGGNSRNLPPEWSIDAVGRKNMLLLIQLRWLAVAGQLLTIMIVHFGMGIRLPLVAMLTVPAGAMLLNIVSLAVLQRRQGVANTELFLALMVDVIALTIQLYLSGGASNPFISLYLLHVVLGAILLDRRSAWVIVLVTAACGAMLAIRYRPLALPPYLAGELFDMHIVGEWLCSVLIAVLLVLFMTRINGNLLARDARLADLRQQAAEEDHIVRMGLLASGAAHELGTPLSSLAVILSDWHRMPKLMRDPQMIVEIEEMQAEVQRCKAIVTSILLSAGEARGEGPEVMPIRTFLDDIVNGWREAHPQIAFEYSVDLAGNLRIVSDPVIKQVIGNVLDNAGDAGSGRVGLLAMRNHDMLMIAVHDDGPGFAPETLANFGKPYQSSKGKLGGGLGLFLVVNVMRKLGGEVTAINGANKGAVVTLTFPLSMLGVDEDHHAR
jgi:two-component system sensor histidine kinase RegB